MAAEHEGRLGAVVDHGAETRSLFVDLSAPLVFRPGQFVSSLLPVRDETIIRPYSIASNPEDPMRLELLLNLVPGGPGSHYLFGLPVGAPVRFTGPWGTFVLDEAPDAEAVFIADGTGIAPIRPMLHRALAAAHHPLHLLYGTSRAGGVVYQDEIDALARADARFRFARVPSASLRDEVIRRWIDGDADRTRRFYICGVGAIVPELRDLLRRAGYERRAVQYEKW